jgi:hypothetical protein
MTISTRLWSAALAGAVLLSLPGPGAALWLKYNTPGIPRKADGKGRSVRSRATHG